MHGAEILMVHIRRGDHDFWTLPGGGVEPGETPEQAVVREFKEETGLSTHVLRLLFETTYQEGPEYCFLLGLTPESSEATLGYDPEFSPDEQSLVALAWKPLHEVSEDKQVRVVLHTLEQMGSL